MPEPQYIALDIRNILQNVPVNSRGKALAQSIENTTWYNFEDPRINVEDIKTIVSKLKSTNRRSFPMVMGELKEYADNHNIWINEE